MNTDRYYTKVLDALRLLALPYSAQKSFLPDFVDAPFEIIDTYEKSFFLLPSILESKPLSIPAIANLIRVKGLIELYFPEPMGMDEDEFQFSKGYSILRETAKITLISLNEEIKDPNPNNI